MDTRINHDATFVDTNTGEVIDIESGSKIVSPQRQK